MTASTIRKRAERLRRKEAGQVRVEAWLSPEAAKHLERVKCEWSLTTDQAVNYALFCVDV